METAQQHLAGIDVHKKTLVLVVRRERGERREYEKRKFGTTRKEIEHLAARCCPFLGSANNSIRLR
jgi:hypothetical protein